MVEGHVSLDRVFGALADPSRRRILEMLLPREFRVTEIAESFAFSLAAVSKHLRVLERAGLIERRREGRTHQLRAKPEAIASAHAWIAQYARGWTDGLDSLEEYLDTHHRDSKVTNPPPTRRKKKGRNDGR